MGTNLNNMEGILLFFLNFYSKIYTLQFFQSATVEWARIATLTDCTSIQLWMIHVKLFKNALKHNSGTVVQQCYRIPALHMHIILIQNTKLTWLSDIKAVPDLSKIKCMENISDWKTGSCLWKTRLLRSHRCWQNLIKVGHYAQPSEPCWSAPEHGTDIYLFQQGCAARCMWRNKISVWRLIQQKVTVGFKPVLTEMKGLSPVTAPTQESLWLHCLHWTVLTCTPRWCRN